MPAKPSDFSAARLDARSLALRKLVIGALVAAKRGHPGPALSLVEILRVLYDDVLRVRPDQPDWRERDRCILSKGHGCLALYAVLADKGFFPVDELSGFCTYGSRLGGHPEFGIIPGVEASTGALGHGLSIGLGLALAARMQRQDWRVFVVTGDGELDEGSVWEAALSAGKHHLENLVAIVDHNKLQSYGLVSEVQDLSPLADKWRSFGFGVVEVDGHDVAALRRALTALPFEPGKPSVLICHTIKGRGVPDAESNPDWHHKNALTEAELASINAALGDFANA
ncbi:MAG: transketolase [Alphaproteobacteria bacterium]|nr:transketolase [Alphaproteobacteria bacterium]